MVLAAHLAAAHVRAGGKGHTRRPLEAHDAPPTRFPPSAADGYAADLANSACRGREGMRVVSAAEAVARREGLLELPRVGLHRPPVPPPRAQGHGQEPRGVISRWRGKG